MKYFSTFSGIGGFELGIIQAYENTKNRRVVGNKQETYSISGRQEEVNGSRMGNKQGERPSDEFDQSTPTCIGYSEIDKYATQIYEKHFGCTTHQGQGIQGTRIAEGFISQCTDKCTNRFNDSPHHNYGDITKINENELPDFDMLVGGFPCQSFSIAGKRGGFEDTRGTMFFELARILRAKKPRLFCFENVKGLLSHDNGNTFKTIISALDELGYDLQWQVVNSKNHGVPQNRERVFIVGHLRGTSRPEVFPFSYKSNPNTTFGKSTKTTVARPLTGGGHSGGNHSGMTIIQENNPTHSNDRVYEASGISPTLNTMQGGMRQPFIKVPEATKKGYAEAHIGQSINLAVPNSKTRRGRVSDIAQTIDTGMQQHTLTSDMKIRRLTSTECERLQGFPDGWTEKGLSSISDTQRYKTLGNAVTVNVIQVIMEKLLLTNEQMKTVRLIREVIKNKLTNK